MDTSGRIAVYTEEMASFVRACSEGKKGTLAGDLCGDADNATGALERTWRVLAGMLDGGA